ncbi:MAG: site-specific DNA-methyltransferase [Proteobacteria bacterium]|jgi:site-specific DNA-methyltransferase (adenine-specific)|nr:site-specific DNA-methyltransferase [Pseudomonadota bacterium]
MKFIKDYKDIGKVEPNSLILGDCLEVMRLIPDNSVHAVICDLPYGTTYCKWDSVIPLDKLWEQYKRIIIGNGAFVFTASQPFTTILIQSNMDWFKYEWIWNKENPTNFANAKHQPLKQHENIVVFSKGKSPYYPIKIPGKPNHKQGASKKNVSETRLISERVEDDLSGMKYPKSILYCPKHSSQCKYHPTEKPVALMEYLIYTYTKDFEVVLDNTAGSGSTLVACADTGRQFIGIEKEEKYFNIACERLNGI